MAIQAACVLGWYRYGSWQEYVAYPFSNEEEWSSQHQRFFVSVCPTTILVIDFGSGVAHILLLSEKCIRIRHSAWVPTEDSH